MCATTSATAAMAGSPARHSGQNHPPCQTRLVDEYEAEDAAVQVARDEPGFDETRFRSAFRVGYNAARRAGYSDGYSEGFSESLKAGFEAANTR
jgi:hypothetical protein